MFALQFSNLDIKIRVKIPLGYTHLRFFHPSTSRFTRLLEPLQLLLNSFDRPLCGRGIFVTTWQSVFAQFDNLDVMEAGKRPGIIKRVNVTVICTPQATRCPFAVGFWRFRRNVSYRLRCPRAIAWRNGFGSQMWVGFQPEPSRLNRCSLVTCTFVLVLQNLLGMLRCLRCEDWVTCKPK
ncbi:hypothetical protein CBM2605_A260034 [Cupriavidus neocaledonicus]|uniref:Uncharacterized protein n=1 Tax=Cupriavidus neocaledonicus TaxID=1040979 RepID=A0ABY1V0H0_9BURK|nr:hypothetical protein CBM2605_A260034 [Cupriavidus neocaledonicus]